MIALSPAGHELGAPPAPLGDEVVRLREWGTDRIHALPEPSAQALYAGTSEACALRLADRSVLPVHAELIHERGRWRIRDLGSTAGLRHDGEPRGEFVLAPGVEVGIGSTTLIAESPRSIALRGFCARLLGWGGDRVAAVDHALRAIRLAAARRSVLVLRGEDDLVPIAHALHRRVLGAHAPFVVCDRRRRDTRASVRSPANHERSTEAFRAAAGGSLCVRSRRLPHDVPDVIRLLHEPGSRVQLIVCMDRDARDASLLGALPIELPSLALREAELPRIVEEYARDAIAELHAPAGCFTDDDRAWVREHATSLPEIEKATLRAVALELSANLNQAAALLGMAQVSLSRWFRRRGCSARPSSLAPTGRSPAELVDDVRG